MKSYGAKSLENEIKLVVNSLSTASCFHFLKKKRKKETLSGQCETNSY